MPFCEQRSLPLNSLLYHYTMSIREGMTVKVVGNLREYEGKTHVLVYDVTPITDWNELTHHILETILTHCKNTKPSPVSRSMLPYLACL